MDRWQYKIIDNGTGDCNPDDQVGMDYLGNDGWELAGVGKSAGPYGGTRFYFKKKVHLIVVYGPIKCSCGYDGDAYLLLPCPRCGKETR